MNWGAEFTARFAPIAEWNRVGVRQERFTESAFENQGLSRYPEVSRTIPVVLRHEKDKTAAAIERIWRQEGWWHARFKLNPSKIHACIAVDHLKVGTPVSPCFIPVRWTDNGAARQYDRAWLSELSILMYNQRPAYRGAQVSFIAEPPEMSKAEVDALLERARNLPTPTDVSVLERRPNRGAASDSYEENYRPPFWDKLGRIVGYRVTDANFERAMTEASRSSLDRLYAEHMAAKHQREPQVIVRHNIGTVLGVG